MAKEKNRTCLIQLDEIIRTSKSIQKNRTDKKEYELQLSRYQTLFSDPKENLALRQVALKVIQDFQSNKSSAAKYKIKGNVFEIVRNLNFKKEISK